MIRKVTQLLMIFILQEGCIMTTDTTTISAIEKLFHQYEQEILEAKNNGYLKENTVKTYLVHSGNFVKWCNGEFEPGLRNK